MNPKQLELDTENGDRVVPREIPFRSAAVVAKACGVSRQAVSKAVTQGRLKQNPDGSFDRASVAAWRASVGSDGATQDDPTFRLKTAKAELAEMERDEMKGKLIRRCDVERGFTERAYEFSRGLLMLKRRVSSKIAEKSKLMLREVEEILDAEARELLEQYTRPLNVEPRK